MPAKPCRRRASPSGQPCGCATESDATGRLETRGGGVVPRPNRKRATPCYQRGCNLPLSKMGLSVSRGVSWGMSAARFLHEKAMSDYLGLRFIRGPPDRMVGKGAARDVGESATVPATVRVDGRRGVLARSDSVAGDVGSQFGIREAASKLPKPPLDEARKSCSSNADGVFGRCSLCLQGLFRGFHQQPPGKISQTIGDSCRLRSGGCE